MDTIARIGGKTKKKSEKSDKKRDKQQDLMKRMRERCRVSKPSLVHEGLTDAQAGEMTEMMGDLMVLMHTDPESWPLDESHDLKSPLTDNQKKMFDMLELFNKKGLEYGLNQSHIMTFMYNLKACRYCSDY